MITRRKRLRVKREVAGGKPTLWIGKSGVTPEVVGEVKKQLRKNEVVKIKILKKALEQTTVKALAKDLVDKTGSELIEARGHTLILYKIKANSN